MKLRGANNLENVNIVLVLKGLFGGSLKITLQNKNSPRGENNLRRFSGMFFGWFGCFQLFFDSYPGTSPMTHWASFSAAFQLFSMSGIQHLFLQDGHRDCNSRSADLGAPELPLSQAQEQREENEYDRAKGPLYNGSAPRPPLVV